MRAIYYSGDGDRDDKEHFWGGPLWTKETHICVFSSVLTRVLCAKNMALSSQIKKERLRKLGFLHSLIHPFSKCLVSDHSRC